MTRKKEPPDELREALRRLGIRLDDDGVGQVDWDELEDWEADWEDDDAALAAAEVDLIGDGIERLTVADLRAVAKGFGWPLKGVSRDQITAQIAAHYRDPDRIRQAVASVSESDKQRLALLVCVGVAPRRIAEQQAALFAERLAGRPGGVSFNHADVERLRRRGLVLRVSDGPAAAVTVAPTFIPALPKLRLLAPPADLAGLRPDLAGDPLSSLLAAWLVVAEAASPVVDPFEAGSYDARTLWRTLPAEDAQTRQAHKAFRIPNAPGPFPEPLRATMRQAAGLDEPGLGSFLGALLLSLGLVTVNRDQLTAVAEERDALLQLDAIQLRLALMTAWLALPYGLWDEFTAARLRGEALRAYRTAQNWYFAPAEFTEHLRNLREATLISLRWLPADRAVADGWAALAELDALLRAAYPEAVAPAAKAAPWYVAVTPGTPLDGKRELDWRRGHAPIWHLIFDGPLRWLGLVETARDARGELAALRLTPVAAALLNGTEIPTTPGAGLAWGAALDVTVTPSQASAGVVAALMQLAEPGPMADGRLHFRFTPAAAQRAFQAGAVPADLHARLMEAGAPPPAAVAEALALWWESWGTAHRYDDLALLEVTDETLMAELLARPGVAEHGVFRCGPTTLALDPAAVDKVVAQLRRWGYLAKVVDA